MIARSFILSLFPILFFVLPAFSATKIGVAESVKVSVSANGKRSISVNSALFQNETLAVNSTGLAHLKFSDGTKMVLGPNARLKLDRTVFDPSGSRFSKFVLNSASGATRFITGSSRSQVFEIVTPVSALGVRGTAFDFRHWRGRTYLMVLSGQVEICNRARQCVTVRRKCDFVIVQPGGRISQPIQPRNSQFSQRDFQRYFPFVEDQRPLEASYRLRTNSCQRGRGAGGGGGVGGGGAGSGVGGGGQGGRG